MRPGRAVVEVVNCGFQLTESAWLEQHSILEESVLRHFRLIARQPPGERQSFTKLEGWNANATVPWRAMRWVFGSIVTTFDEHMQLRRAPEHSGKPWGAWPRVECNLWGTCKLKGMHGAAWETQCDEVCQILNSTEPGCPERMHFLAKSKSAADSVRGLGLVRRPGGGQT